jgi:hypothetical protein
MTRTMSLAGTTLELVERDHGRPPGVKGWPKRSHGSNSYPGDIG